MQLQCAPGVLIVCAVVNEGDDEDYIGHNTGANAQGPYSSHPEVSDRSLEAEVAPREQPAPPVPDNTTNKPPKAPKALGPKPKPKASPASAAEKGRRYEGLCKVCAFDKRTDKKQSRRAFGLLPTDNHTCSIPPPNRIVKAFQCTYCRERFTSEDLKLSHQQVCDSNACAHAWKSTPISHVKPQRQPQRQSKLKSLASFSPSKDEARKPTPRRSSDRIWDKKVNYAEEGELDEEAGMPVSEETYEAMPRRSSDRTWGKKVNYAEEGELDEEAGMPMSKGAVQATPRRSSARVCKK